MACHLQKKAATRTPAASFFLTDTIIFFKFRRVINHSVWMIKSQRNFKKKLELQRVKSKIEFLKDIKKQTVEDKTRRIDP